MDKPLLLLLLLCSLYVFSLVYADHHESSLGMLHFNGGNAKGMTWEETLTELNTKDESRLRLLLAASTDAMKFEAPIASGKQILQSNNYVVRVDFGTPAQSLLLAVDISNDAAWIPCSQCVGCPSNAMPFRYKSSATFRPVHCDAPQCKQVPNSLCTKRNTCRFTMNYGSSILSAALSQDTVHIAGDEVRAYKFGCIRKVSGRNSLPPQGLLGLGRGPTSFTSQTHSTYRSTFSYCLPSFRSLNFSGSLRLGHRGQPRTHKHTRLLSNPHRPSLYYVNLVAVVVGRRRVHVPRGTMDFNPTTGAGTIFDSGTMFTRLVAPLYNAVRDELRRQVGKKVTSLGGFDTCFTGPVKVPTIKLKFRGMTMVLPSENSMIHSSSRSITCLAMAAAPNNVNSVVNVIANMQQQNYRVVIDVPRSRLGIARESCTAL